MLDNPVFFVLIYFIVVLLLGFLSWFKIKTPADYYVAGKKAKLLPVTGSLMATILGGSAILGTIELSSQIGWAAIWFLLCASFGLFLLAPVAKYVSRYGKFTLPGLLGYFFGERARLISSIIIPAAWLGIVAAQIIAAGKILAGLGFVSYNTAAVSAGIIFIIYTLLGGQISILRTDIFQSVLIVIGLVSLFIFAIRTPAASQIPPFKATALFNESFSGIDLLILVLTYSVTYVVGPDIYSRLFSAKNEKTATASVIIVALLLIPVSFLLTFLGIFSDTTGSTELISFAEELLPVFFYGLFIAALLSAVMSSADTTLLTSSIILSELFYPDIDNPKAFRLTRLLTIILGILAIVTALYVTSVLQSLLMGLAFFSGAFVIPVLAGLLNLKVVKSQVTAAIIAGGITALAGKIINISGHSLTGNIVIITAFAVNAGFLFIRIKKIR